MPVPGWSGDYDWIGYIPYQDMPFVLNPITHFIATANNKVVSSNYSYLIICDWSPPWRAQRINTFLNEKDKLSPQDFRNIQADVYDIPATIFTPYLIELSPENPIEKTALELMKNWDFRDDPVKPAPAIFHSFYVRLLRNIFVDELGERLYQDYVRAQGGSGDVHTVALANMCKDADNPWFDDIKTGKKETSNEIIKKSFSEAVTGLYLEYGSTPSSWRWGDLHKTPFNHVLGRIKPLNLIFDIGTLPTPGSRYTVDVSAYDPGKPFEVTVIPSYRQIVDWSDPDNALSMHTTGQSGLPFHPHYKDMVPEWLAVNYHHMLFNRANIEAAKRSLLILKP